MKLDRSRAALVVVDVQEAFRPGRARLRAGGAQRRRAGAGRARARAADARHRAVPEGPRAHGARGGRAPRRRRADREGLLQRGPGGRFLARAAGGAPRPGAAVRHRVARVRQPDRRGPARRRRRGARRAGRGHVAHGREPRARPAQDGALGRGRRRASRPPCSSCCARPARRSSRKSRRWSNERLRAARGRHAARRRGGGRARSGARRGRLQHGDDRLPGGGHRSLLRGPDHHLHLSADRQLRRLAAGASSRTARTRAR